MQTANDAVMTVCICRGAVEGVTAGVRMPHSGV